MTVELEAVGTDPLPADNCNITGRIRSSGTAVAGQDFTVTETFVLSGDLDDPGDTLSAPLKLTIIDNATPDPTRIISLSVSLTTVSCSAPIVNAANSTITILDNDPGEPPAVADDSAVTQANTPVTIDVLANDMGFGRALTIIAVTAPANGNAVVEPDDSITYIPNSGFVGTDTFSYTASDDITSASATVTVDVGPGIANIPGQTEEQMEITQALEVACISTESPDLAAQCAGLGSLSAEQKQDAIRKILPTQVSAQGTFAAELHRNLLRNDEARLLSLRSGATGLLTVSGLSVSVNQDDLPIGQLADAKINGAEKYDVMEALRGMPLSPGVMADTMRELENGGGASADEPVTPSRLGIFLNGQASFGDKDQTEREAGFDFNTSGLTLGVDYRLSPDLVIGGALGYGTDTADFVAEQGSLDIDTFTGSIYTSFYVPESMFLDTILMFGDNDYKTVRNIVYTGVNTSTAGDTKGSQFGIGINGGKEIFIGGGYLVSPLVRFEYLKTDIDAYRETGGDGWALAIEDQSIESAKLAIAAEISRAFKQSWGAFVPHLHVEWENQLKDDSREIVASMVEAPDAQFVLPTDKPDKSYFNLGFGFTGIVGENIGFLLGAETTLDQKDIQNTTVNAEVRIEF